MGIADEFRSRNFSKQIPIMREMQEGRVRENQVVIDILLTIGVTCRYLWSMVSLILELSLLLNWTARG